jgi:CRISPR-associated protein Csy2
MPYLLIPHLKVQAANIHSAGCLVGGAPIVAASLFSHALARELNNQDRGVVVIHHDRHDLGEYAYGRFYPQQRRGAAFIGKNDYSSKNKHALSLQPTATAHLHLSLIIEFDVLNQLEQVKAWLKHARFAGGQVTQFGELLLRDDEWCAMDEAPHGFVLLDRRQWLHAHQQQHGGNRLQALIHMLAHTDQARPWLSAAVVGYAALEPTAWRGGVRENWPHAYAEPLIGLVQYVPLAYFLKHASADHQQTYQSGQIDVVWRRDWQSSTSTLSQPDVFLMLQHHEEV